MTLHPRWKGRAAGLWVGIAVAWIAVLVVAYIRFRVRFAPIMVISGVIAILGGALRTRRIRAECAESLITVDDLRRR